MIKARACILLGISLAVSLIGVGAAERGETAVDLGADSSRDTARVFSSATQSHELPKWTERSRRYAELGNFFSDHASYGPRVPLGTFERGATPSSGPLINQALYGADGNVLDMAQSGNTLYIAGSFRSVGENSGGCVPFDVTTGQELPAFPRVAGSVYAIVPDGSGGWFLGGDFSGVGGQERSCLAQIRADGSVSDWNPNVTGSPGYISPPAVGALAVRGNRVFVGGDYGFIGGQPRMDLGCVDAQTGAVLDWIADTPEDGYVRALALQGDTLFVGGGFSHLGGLPRNSLAGVNATTGEVLPWRVDLYGGANALMICGDTLYVGGDFTEIGGWVSSKLAAASIKRASPLPIDFRVNGIYRQYLPGIQVDALAKSNDTLYVVGNFTQIGGRSLAGIAALDATTGDALAWSPDSTGPRDDGYPPPLCLSVAVSGGAVYIGGYFGFVEGAYHPYVAAWDRQTGKVLDWTPTPDDAVLTFAVRGDTLYAGGFFHMVGGWQHRAGLAAIDVATGRLKPWNPNPSGDICTAIAAVHDRVIVSGDFSTIGGDPQPRSYFAALDTVNGEVTAWNPGANDLATAFLASGDTLYIGGYFTQLGGQPRNFVAAVDAASGEILPWDPSADYPVLALARSGGTVFLGGLFSLVGGQPRTGLAAVDDATGVPSSWNPGSDNSTVKALLVAGNTLYVGGAFGMIGGQARNAIAAVDVATAGVMPWYPPPTAWGVPTEVKALALHDSLLYIGGAFATMNGQPRICLAAVDTSTAVATSWDPGLDGYVWSLLASGNTIYAGGGFSRAGGIPANDLAAFTLAPPPSPPPNTLVLAQCFPNPARASTQLRFGLPGAAVVTLSVYDLQGRRITVPLSHALLGAGPHSVQIQTQGWRPGVYLCRLEAGGWSAARKMLVVR